ncbi:DUF981 family protein [Actinotignum sanguinis]|uniref:DUF981 family protein n=1 Tax=Actinotignum TaxID=1653174 RepID=UPI00237E40ED|nr:DUF981 family protein [Actinotignum sanguinis]MDE1552655.1 DUF981 family protein [Actinotignum sanguinis]MDE1565388.1 DUF981 family protein [Actinotignum sanguinis]MDE1642205.1 DUF981 family protein [Actinotignum sanguinis]MDK7198394.1 DUF981 family protein [Actinotignum sanguinis]MDK8287240.1 DUF981 family protein [Actinotignum sanguinis]
MNVGDFFTGESTPGMIDWASMPTYNTIMAIAAGVGLILVGRLLAQLRRAVPAAATEDADRAVSLDGYTLGFFITGLIQTLTGLHMSLTWPLAAGGFPFDNIIFGETCLGFGALLLAASFILWKRGERILTSATPFHTFARIARPVSIFALAMGLALLAIMCAGMVYQFFAAPPQEPISGSFAAYPWLESIALSAVFGLAGVGAILFFGAVRLDARGQVREGVVRAAYWCLVISGVIFMLFGAMNFYTHIGLVVNTM